MILLALAFILISFIPFCLGIWLISLIVPFTLPFWQWVLLALGLRFVFGGSS